MHQVSTQKKGDFSVNGDTLDAIFINTGRTRPPSKLAVKNYHGNSLGQFSLWTCAPLYDLCKALLQDGTFEVAHSCTNSPDCYSELYNQQ